MSRSPQLSRSTMAGGCDEEPSEDYQNTKWVPMAPAAFDSELPITHLHFTDCGDGELATCSLDDNALSQVGLVKILIETFLC